MNKRYAVFDMDGTLVDSMGYWKSLSCEFLETRGISPVPEDILERIKPMTLSESVSLFIREFSLTDTFEEIGARMYELMERHYREDVLLKEGVHEYLDSLARDGVQMCVASATPEPLIRLCLERLGILDMFSFILSCETVGAGKDKPDIYLEVAGRLGCRPEEAAVFEDALYAARTAKHAGFYVVGVYDESAGEHWDEITGLSDQVIHSFREEQKREE